MYVMMTHAYIKPFTMESFFHNSVILVFRKAYIFLLAFLLLLISSYESLSLLFYYIN